MLDLIKSYLKEKGGATAIEYTLIAAGVGLAVATTVSLIGADVESFFLTIRSFL